MSTQLRTPAVFHGRTRPQHDLREVAAPAFVGKRLLAGLIAGLGGAAAYLVPLVVVALAQGRSALYPLRAIYAIFNGNRYLPGYAIYPLDYGWFEVAKSVVWVVSLGVIVALPLALFAPGSVLRGGHRATWLALGVGWSMVAFLVGFGLFGFPAPRVVQRYGSSFQGARDLGIWAFALAHVAYGFVAGRLLCGRTRENVLVRRT